MNETFTHNGHIFQIDRADDFSGWIARRPDASVIGKFPSLHVAQVACEFAALKL